MVGGSWAGRGGSPPGDFSSRAGGVGGAAVGPVGDSRRRRSKRPRPAEHVYPHYTDHITEKARPPGCWVRHWVVSKLAEHGNQQANYPDGNKRLDTRTVIPGVLALCLQCVAETDGDEIMRAIEGLLMKEVDLKNQGLTNVELGAQARPCRCLEVRGPTPLELKCNQSTVWGRRAPAPDNWICEQHCCRDKSPSCQQLD